MLKFKTNDIYGVMKNPIPINLIQDNFTVLQQEIIDLQNQLNENKKQLNKEKKLRRKQSWKRK